MKTFYWSRVPGKFVDKTTGEQQTGAAFTGTVREWYETLIEVMIDLGLTLRRESADPRAPLRYLSWRGDANVCLITQASVLYKPIFGPPTELGTLRYDERGIVFKEDDRGVVINIPIEPERTLYCSGLLELVQFVGSEHEKVLGQIQVLDCVIR